MLQADRLFGDAVGRKVAELEQATDAEIVVVAATRSGSYRDLEIWAAAGLGFVTLAALVLLPWHVHPVLALLDVAFATGVAAWALRGRAIVLRLAPLERQAAQVAAAAAAEFHLESVHATPRRTGVLVYVSAQERMVEIVPDLGVEALVPRAQWAEVARAVRADDLDSFLGGLERVGKVLGTFVPRAGERGVALSDAPRIRA
jgi:putative membrane protein